MKRLVFVALLVCAPVFGQQTNALPVSLGAASSSSAIFSLFRVAGALAMVLAMFFAGVYLFKNWQRLMIRKSGRSPKLQVVEAKSLGPRQALYVISYESKRLLIASSPAGIAMLTALPEEDLDSSEALAAPVNGSFADALMRTISLHR